MTATRAWDRAEYSCGRCGFRFTSTTEPEYVRRYASHQKAHEMAEGLEMAAAKELWMIFESVVAKDRTRVG